MDDFDLDEFEGFYYFIACAIVGIVSVVRFAIRLAIPVAVFSLLVSSTVFVIKQI